MRRQCLCLLILLLPLAQAAELKLSADLDTLSYAAGDTVSLNPVLENLADVTVAANLSVKFKVKRESWELIEQLDCGGVIELAPHESKERSCSYLLPLFLEAGTYKFYVRADIIGGTYTYKDLVFEVREGEFKEESSVAVYEPLEEDSEFPFLFSGVTLFFGLLAGLFLAGLKYKVSREEG